MRRKQGMIALVTFLAPAGLVLGASFAWTGGGSNDDWDDCDNWTCSGCGAFSECFPGNSNDDVSIGGDDESATLVEAEEEIEDLALKGIFTFTGGAVYQMRELTAESLTIDGATSGATIYIQSNALLTGDTVP